MPPLLLVMLGGALGSAARYGFVRLGGAMLPGVWPWSVFAVNVLGGFLMGMLSALILRGTLGEAHRLALGVGVLGGFTTFSSFSLDTANLIDGGHPGLALVYAGGSVIAALAALYVGLALGRAL